MPKSTSTISVNPNSIDELEKIEDELMGVGEKVGRGGGSKRGEKTVKAIIYEERKNALESRVNDSQNLLKESLKHFPQSEHAEVNDKRIDEYAEWVFKYLVSGGDVIKENDITFENFKASGPGGQNINKVANAVRCRHAITGIYSSSQKHKETIANKDDAKEHLYVDLSELLKNWRLTLTGIKPENWKEAVKAFVEKSQEK